MATAFVTREKDLLADEIAILRKQNADLTAQQSSWEELRRTTEHMQSLAALFGQVNSEEIEELRRTRDRYRALESEHSSLQRRFRDQEVRLSNSERTTATARQSLSQAQQRAVEWEKRVQDREEELETARTRIGDLEQAHSQMDAEVSLLKMQAEERDAHERLAKVSILICVYLVANADYVFSGSREQAARPDCLTRSPANACAS